MQRDTLAPGGHASQQSYDLTAPDVYRNPYPLLADMREHCPVYYCDELESWVVTRYDDVREALRDDRLGVVVETKRIDQMSPAQQLQFATLRRNFEAWGGRFDTGDHARFTRLFKPRFTPSRVRAMRPRIQEILDRLLDDALARGELDIARDIAHPLPMTLVAEVTGVPTDQLDVLLGLANDIANLFRMNAPDQYTLCQDGMRGLAQLLAPVIAAHRARPPSDLAGDLADDLIGVLIEADRQGLGYDDDTIVAQCTMFLVVGYHTSANFMCNGLQLLFDHPDQRAKLERRSELLPNAIEEMMRFHGPAATVRRLAKVDYELRGAQIRAGDTLMLVLASANRDPAVFSEPDRFDIERVNANQHLGFANGPYACLGQALARMEGQVFYETLLRRLSGLRPVDIEPDWVQFRPLEREVESLPVLYDAEPRCG